MSNAITAVNTNRITIGGTIAANAVPGVYSFTVSSTGAVVCTGTDIEIGTITIPSATVTLTSAAPTESQSVCVNSAITPITYSVVGATGASEVAPTSLVVDGLPAGVTGNYAANVFTISGTPTVTVLTETIFTYTINTTGASCAEGTVSGTISVAPAQQITPVSVQSVRIQDVCNPSLAITPIIYNITGASTISPSTVTVTAALPAGLSATQKVLPAQGNTINVTGAATGTHSIAINGEVFTFGSAASSTAEQIRNGLIAAINASSAIVTASNGASSGELILTADVAGVPFEVNFGGYRGVANLSNTVTTPNTNQIEITGTLAASVTAGTYSFTLNTYAGASPTCAVSDTEIGSVTLKTSSTLALTSAAATASQTVCVNTAITSITYTYGGGATNATVANPTMVVDGLPTGVTATVSSLIKTITLDGSPSVTTSYTTTYNYIVSSVGSSGCPEVVMYGSIIVEPEELIVPVSSAAVRNNQNLCVGDTITDIIYDIKGSALTISPSQPLSLPLGISAAESKTQQSNTVTITGAVTGTYIVGVNGSVVSYTYITGNTNQIIRTALKNAINGDATINNVVLAADVGTDALSITAKVSGTPFSIQIGGSAGAGNMSNAITAVNTNRIIIGGTIAAGTPSATYTYTVSTTGAVVCTGTDIETGTINVSASSSITLTSVVTSTSQIVCNNSSAVSTITYLITGATSATVIPPSGLLTDGLPNGITFSFDAGTSILSIVGTPATSDLVRTVYTYTVLTADVISGCATATISGTITVDPLEGGVVNGGVNQIFCRDAANLAIVPTALAVTGSTAAGAGIQYQWQSKPAVGNWVDIAGETSVGYSVPSIAVTTHYRRKIMRVNGSPSDPQCTAFSSVHIITVDNVDVGQIGMPTQICYGTVPDQLVSVRNATSSGTIAYQWQYSADDAVWFDIANETQASYTPSGALIATSYYRRQVISSLDGQLNRVTITGSPNNPNNITISINGIATSVTTGTSTGTYANILIDQINANGAIPVTASQTASGVIDLVHNTPGTPFTLVAGPGSFTLVDDSTPASCPRNSPSVKIEVVDEILKANTNDDQAICFNTTPVDISATGLSPVAPAPNIGAITYQWYGSTDNSSFTALGAGYNGVTTAVLDPQTALTQTTYFKLTTTNTYPIYPVQRFTITGNGSAISEAYTLSDGATTVTYTTVVTTTLRNTITSELVSLINNTAPLNTVIEAYDYQSGIIDIRGKVAGTAINITAGTVTGTANVSGLSVLKATTATCTTDSEVTTVIVSPLEEITLISGPLNQTVCEGQAITPVSFKAGGGAADLQILPTIAYDITDNGDTELGGDNEQAANPVIPDTVEPRLGTDAFNYYPNAATNSQNDITMTRLNGVYTFSGIPSVGTIDFDILTESYQKDRIDISGNPKIGEKYNVIINTFTVSVIAATTSRNDLINSLVTAINADPRVNGTNDGSATRLGVGALSTASGTIMISGRREDTKHTIGFSNEQAQAISTIALTGTTNSAGEVYNIIINGIPYIKTYGTGVTAATIATEFSLLINNSALVSSTVNAGTITIEAKKRGIPLVISTVAAGTTPQIGFTTTATQSATTSTGSIFTLTPFRCFDCIDPQLDGSITRAPQVRAPQYILANYALGSVGNSQLQQETIVDTDGTRIYNGASCDTPEIASFEACGGGNIAGYQWSITAGAGTINSSTGAVVWNPNFVGTATISVAANGCNGPSNTQNASFEIYAADPIEEHIYVSSVVAVSDVVSVTIDGQTHGYSVTGAPLTITSTVASITALINSNFNGAPYNVAATAVANTYVQVVTNDAGSPAFELTVTASSTTTSVTAVTINSVSTTLQVPSTPTEPAVLELKQKSVIRIVTNRVTNTSMVPAGEIYKVTINGRCYDYITQAGGTTDDQIRNSFLSQINGATHKFRKFDNGSEFGVTASTAPYADSSLYVEADYLGYSDYGTMFVFDKDIQNVPGNNGSPAYDIGFFTERGITQEICGPDIITGALPNCEITAATRSTQFFAESENYQYITWSLSNVSPGTGAISNVPGDNLSAATFTQRGIIDWSTGFHGTFTLNATAMGCDGVTTSQVSTKQIVIKSRAVTPTSIIVTTPLPTCPGGTNTTTFYSDPGSGNSVTWSINNNNAGVINCDTGVLTWNPEFSGTVNIKATSTGCGAPFVEVPFDVPPKPVLTRTSAPVTEVQDVCVNTSLVTITYDLIGSAPQATISWSPSTPSGVQSGVVPSQMIRDILVTGGGNTIASESFKIYINGAEREYVATGTVNKDVVAKQLATVINNLPNPQVITADADTVSGTIRITGVTTGTFFSTSLLETSAALSLSTSTNPVQGVGEYQISGLITQPVSTPTRYTYTLTTSGACSPGTATGYITVEPNSLLIQNSAVGTENQELCVGETIVDVELEVFNGATTASVAPLNGLNGLPPGLTTTYTPQFTEDDISFSGATNTGSTTETYSLILSVPGAGNHVVSFTAPPNSTVATVRAGLTYAINQYAKQLTVTGQGTAITDSWTVTVTTDIARSVTFTATQTITSKEQIVTGLVSEVNNTAGIKDVVEAVDIGGGKLKLLGKVIGVSINTISHVVSGTGNISGPITLDITSSMTATNTASGTIKVTAQVNQTPQGVVVVSAPTINITVTPVKGTGVFTISGTPSVTLNNMNVYTYTVNTAGNAYSCEETSFTGAFRLKPPEIITHPTSIATSTFASGTSTNGLLSQQVCDGSELDGIRFDLSGSAISAGVASLTLFNGLPNGIQLIPFSTAQVNTTHVTGTMSENISFSTSINGTLYTYSSVATPTYQNVVDNLVQEINSATGIRLSPVTASASGTTLVLTAKVPGISFSYTATSTNASLMDLTVAGDVANDNYVTITGDPDPVTSATTYFYTIETNGTSCLPHGTISGTITILPTPSVATATVVGTDAQEVCEGQNITDVSFKVYGGAVSLTVQLNGGFDQLPTGISQNFTNTKQSDQITWAGPATAPVTETYGVQINTSTYSVTTIVGETINTFLTRLRNSINADISLDVSASTNANILTLEADASGPYQGYSATVFSLTATSSYTLSQENISGTGLLTLSGAPDLTGISPLPDAPMTFTYIVQTLGNIYSSCSVSSTTQSATLTVIPAEQLIYAGTITSTLFSGATVSTTTNGELSQAVCEGGDIDGIRIEIGGSATGATVAALVGQNGIPPGVTLSSPFQQSQVQTTKVSGTLTVSETFTIKINGISYPYTIQTGDSDSVVATNLSNVINLASGIRLSPVTASALGSIITLTADQSGKSFSYTTSTTTNTLELDDDVAGDVENLNYVTITGSPSEVVSSTKTYTFDVVSSGTSCTPHAKQTVSISILPNSKITLTSGSGTDGQEVCDSSALGFDITYELSNGATAVALESADFGQQDRINISGVFAANDKVTVTIDETDYEYTVPSGATGIDNIITNLVTGMSGSSVINAIPDLANDAIYLKSSVDGAAYSLELKTTTGTVTSTDITPSSTRIFPNGISHTIASQQQVDIVSITGTFVAGEDVFIYITGGSPITTSTYSHTTVGGGLSAINVRDALIAKINTTPGRRVQASAGPGGADITLTANNAGTPFGLSQFTNSVTPTITSVNSVGSHRVTISGTPNVGVTFPSTYFYRIKTTNNLLGCGEDFIQGSIKVNPLEAINYDSSDSNFSGSDNAQQICVGQQIEGIKFNLTGTALTATTPALVGVVGLPPGVLLNQVSVRQLNIIDITASSAIGAQFWIKIDGITYSYTTSTTGDTALNVAQQLVSEINTASGVRQSAPTASITGASSIQIRADVQGTLFDFSFNNSIAGGGALSLASSGNIANENYMTVTGTPNPVTPITTTVAYTFTLTTSGTAGCLPVDTANGTITLTPESTLVLSSGLDTIDQIVCANNAIVPIIYTYGGGATGVELLSNSDPLLTLPTGLVLGNGAAANTVQIIGTPTVTVSQTTIFQYTLRTTGNATCSETIMIGKVTVAPNVVIDSAGIQAAVQDVSCSTAGFTPDGQIGHPVSNTLSSFVTGGVQDTAQVDRVFIIGASTNEDHGVFDTYTVTVDGADYSFTTNDINSDGNPDQTKEQIATQLANQISGGSPSVTAASNIGGLGSLDITANVPGVAFTSSVTHTTDNIIRVTFANNIVASDVVTITAGGSSYSYTVAGGNTLSNVASSLATLMASSSTVTATATGATIDIRTLAVGSFVNFSSTVSSSAMTISTDDRSTEFTKSTIQQNFESTFVYSWSKVGDVGFTNNNLEITGLSEGQYNLTVSIKGLGNGCQASAGPFIIEKPTITIGTVVETCGGTVNIPISGTLTTDQVSGTGNILSVNLYQGTAGAAPSYSLFDTTSYVIGSLTKTFTENLQFTGLTPGLSYRVEVITNTCSEPEFLNFGPISAILEIDESLIVTTDEICAGEADGTISVPLGAITGGSGSYDYQWTRLSPNPQVTYNVKDLNGVSAGFYELTITDSNIANCTVTTVGLVEIKGTDSPITITPSSLNVLANECVSGTDGQIEIDVAGTNTAWIEWEYLVTTSLGVVSSSLSSSTLTPNRRNLLPANFLNEELNPTGGFSSFQNLPAGVYRVKVYLTNPSVNPCADVSQDFVITEPSPVSIAELSGANEPLVTQPPLACSPNDILLGSIQIALSGGQAPYFYSLVGGEPTEAITGSTFLRDDLPAGTYDIVISDSSGCDVVANYLTIPTIVLTDPPGNPLVLTEGTITPIPCEGGTGQFIVEADGGYFSGSVTTTTFPVRIVSTDGLFIINTSISPGQDILVENVPRIGNYVVSVIDESGCVPDASITVAMTSAASSDLSASADLTGVQDCSSSTPSANGPVIKLNGGISGGVAPYTIKWERRSQLELDTFSISFTGSVSSTETGNFGVEINGTTYTSSITVNNTTSILDLAVDLAVIINNDPTLEAYISGSSIVVRSQTIDSAKALSIVSVYGLRMSLSPITITAQTVWNEVSNTAGQEVLTGLNIGYYRGIISDSSGCGGSVLVENLTQGGYVFGIDDPSKLQIQDVEFEDITCVKSTASISFKLGNGQFDLIPDPTVFEFTLNGNPLQSTISNGSSISLTPSSSLVTNVLSGNTYTPNLSTNIVLIQNLQPNSYNLEVKNTQTGCVVLLGFTIEDLLPIKYSGVTDFTISACYDSYQDPFFDQFLVSGGTPYLDSSGQPYYGLTWTYYPDPNSTANSTVFSSLSNNVDFYPLPGVYQLGIKDKNGCTIVDQNGNTANVEFSFVAEFNDILVSGVADSTGAFSSPVSCQLDAADGTIAVSVQNQDGSSAPPYEITWEIQGAELNDNEAILLFQGVSASVDSLEVYSVLINDIPFTYTTQTPNESIVSVVQEMAQVIDNSPQYSTSVESAPNGGITPQDVQIRINSVSGASITLEIVSKSTRLQMLNSSVSSANWTPLDGTNGSINYTGYTSLNNLAEGNYRYTITPAGLSNCVGSNLSQNNEIRGVISVLDENVLQIRQGPNVSPELCSGQPGTIFIDVFDGATGPLSFFYNGSLVVSQQVGEDQYNLEIDAPVTSARLEILNNAGCGIARQINVGIGDPLFDFTSISFQQSSQYIAREDITFRDLSENEYDSFEFIFGDGTQTERLERNQPDPITHEYAVSGTYYATLRIFNEIGCVAEITQTIKIGKGYNVLSPNVFTPNGDIYNQCFKPLFNGLVEVTFRVYDAQGAILYEEIGVPPVDPTKDALTLTGWCGPDLSSDDGKEIVTPYFIYTLEGKTIDDVEVFRDGTFILLR